MPTNTDLVKDLPADFEIFGQAVDTKIKDLNPETTAGDISYRGSTANAKTRLPIGTAGQVLTVNSGATAPEWAAASGFNPILTPQNSGKWLNLLSWGTGTDEANLTEDQTGYAPIFLSGIAFDRIGVSTSSSHTGTSTIRLGLYNASPTTGKPTTVYFDAGTVSCTAPDTEYTITINQTPPAGYYYLAANVQTKTGFPYFYYAAGTTSGNAMFNATSTAIATVANERRFRETGITGAFATAGTLIPASMTSVPIIALRIA